MTKFFTGRDIEKCIFEALCRELQLRVAEIADFESEEGPLNTSVSVNGNREQSLATLTQKLTETDEEKVSFSILGTASKVDLPKLKAIVAHLQKITGDTSIEIVDIEEGSIRLILEGSQKSLEQIEALFKSGQLTDVEGIPVEHVQFVTPKIPEHDEDIQAVDKKRLAFTLAGSVSSEEILELKAAFTEVLDKDEEKEEKETDDKARLVHVVQKIITKVAEGRDLRGTDLRGTDLRGTDLRGARIDVQTKIDSKWRLVWEIVNQGARGRDLIGINLRGAFLRGADLRGAFLIDADLRGTFLTGADLRGAFLTGAFLSEADLSEADLSEADLRGANLRGANLRGASLISLDLTGAYLRSADLRGANLRGAFLRGANLKGTVVENAQFGANSGLTEETKLDLQRRGAIFGDSPGDRSGVLSRR